MLAIVSSRKGFSQSLLAWLAIGLMFPAQTPSLFSQSVSSLIRDVSDIADGSVTQARVEASRQAANGNLPYRSSKEGDSRSFSGQYTPPQLPDDKKGRFVYGLALFSDDGCTVSVEGTPIHQFLGRGQHLPKLGDSFHVLPVAFASEESVNIAVDYSNIIYDDDPESPGYPDIDGSTLFLYLIPAGIAVDANRDGAIAFSGENRDTTTPESPYRFWINDDNDGSPAAEGDVIGPIFTDYQDGFMLSARDLEDFARLHLFFGAFEKELAAGTFRIGLKFKNVEDSPRIRVYKSTDTGGSDSYVKDDGAAFAQISDPDAATLGEVADGFPLLLPVDFWKATSPGATKCLLFEAGGEGKGELIMTINRSSGAQIGEVPGVWLDLKNIKKMYQRFDGSGKNQWESVAFEEDRAEQPNAIVFVHGWRMSPEGASSFGETFYKRLWHRGFKGRFAAFRWDTHWSDNSGWLPYQAEELLSTYLSKYNDSEHNAWLAGSSLASFINNLPSNYSKNVAAHSMGNIVAGLALLAGARIQNYALMQAAVPAACYDENEERIKQIQLYSHVGFTMWDELTPDDDPDSAVRHVAYRGRLNQISGNLTSFYLPQDYATSFAWEVNNDQTKPPDASLAANFRYYRDNLAGTKLYKYHTVSGSEIVDHYLTDPYEAMPYACRTWGKAAGAEGRTQGSIDAAIDLSSASYNLPGESSGFGDEHSAQFEARIQQLKSFYDQILNRFDIIPIP